MLSCWSGAELRRLWSENKVLVYHVCDINVILTNQLADFQNENVKILLSNKPRGGEKEELYSVTVTPLNKYTFTYYVI